MATTQHLVRVLALVPAARRNAVNNWIHTNLDPTGGDWLDGSGYSATGNAPATHYVFNAALTIPEFRALGAQLLQMSSLSLPADWDAKTREEKFTWFRARIPTIRAQTGIRLRVFANDGTWDNPQDELAAAGLLPIATGISAQVVAPEVVTPEAVTPEPTFRARAVERIQTIDWRFVLTRAAVGSAIAAGAIGGAMALAEVFLK